MRLKYMECNLVMNNQHFFENDSLNCNYLLDRSETGKQESGLEEISFVTMSPKNGALLSGCIARMMDWNMFGP